MVFGGFSFVLGEEDSRLCFCFFMLRKKRGGNVYGICHGRYAAECNMITNKQKCWIENLMILDVSLLFLRVGCGRRKQQINHKLCSVLSVPEILINSTTELEPTSQLSWKSWASFMTAAKLLFRR